MLIRFIDEYGLLVNTYGGLGDTFGEHFWGIMDNGDDGDHGIFDGIERRAPRPHP